MHDHSKSVTILFFTFAIKVSLSSYLLKCEAYVILTLPQGYFEILPFSLM
jgi:hypothetical protein